LIEAIWLAANIRRDAADSLQAVAVVASHRVGDVDAIEEAMSRCRPAAD
jgi:hypothetical protein